MAIERAELEIRQGQVAAGIQHFAEAQTALRGGDLSGAREKGTQGVKEVDGIDLVARELRVLRLDLSNLSGRQDIPLNELEIMAASTMDQNPEFGTQPFLPALASLMLEEVRRSAMDTARQAVTALEAGNYEEYQRLTATVPNIIERGGDTRDRILRTSDLFETYDITQPTVAEVLGLDKRETVQPALAAATEVEEQPLPTQVPSTEEIAEKDRLVLLPDRRSVLVDGIKVSLPGRQYELLALLARAGRPVDKEDLIQQFLNPAGSEITLSEITLRSTIHRVNTTVGAKIIINDRKAGRSRSAINQDYLVGFGDEAAIREEEKPSTAIVMPVEEGAAAEANLPAAEEKATETITYSRIQNAILEILRKSKEPIPRLVLARKVWPDEDDKTALNRLGYHMAMLNKELEKAEGLRIQNVNPNNRAPGEETKYALVPVATLSEQQATDTASPALVEGEETQVVKTVVAKQALAATPEAVEKISSPDLLTEDEILLLAHAIRDAQGELAALGIQYGSEDETVLSSLREAVKPVDDKVKERLLKKLHAVLKTSHAAKEAYFTSHEDIAALTVLSLLFMGDNPDKMFDTLTSHLK